ncbi:solute:sodium symporter family transporter [Cognatilysobacter bugurensis]|uniref:Solute:sodium symporter family transporter n=1 Tax=Cognatilysobacter bugurensis TaxID=543356 RepID=A0A918W7I9_9GAMM|nr:solute:sodium symporter family transporter [Lysobacter bugurensis]GHA81789.1 solute:sodium symporter family transporter [Lysobacter bugurensis]
MRIDPIQLAVFLGLTALVALATWWRCRREPRGANESKDFFLAGGTLAWPFIAGSLLLTNLSAEQIVGMNGAQAMLVAWWEFGAAAGLLILAHVLVPMYYRYKCTTTTELLERRLGDPGLRRAVSVLFLLGYMFILLPVVLYTGAVFMKSMFGVDLSILTIAVLFALAGLAYAAFGGLRAIAISDTYNGLGLLVLGIAVTLFALQAVGWDLSGVPAERWTLVGGNDSDIPWHTLLTGMVFIHVFYWGTNMVIAQRALAAGSVREAQKGIYAAAAFKLITPALVVLPGIIAFKLYGDVGDVAYGRLVGDVLPAWMSGAFAAVIAGAVLSSFNSCLNSAAALYTCDIHLAKINPNADARRIGQIVALVFAVVSVAMVPLYQHSQSIIATLQQLNGLYSMPVLAAFVVAVLFSNLDPRALRGGLLFGVALYAVFTFVWSPLHYIHLMFITLVATILVMWGGSRLLAPRARPNAAVPAR